MAEKNNTLKIVLIVVGVVVALVVVGIGVLAAIAVFGTKEYVSAAKEAEGKATVGAISRGAAACFEKEDMSSNVIGGSAPSTHELPATTQPVPASLSAVSGKKYQSSPSDWSGPGWSCMAFSMMSPQYFQYQWVRDSPTKGRAIAKADFDGDGAADVTFERAVDCSSGTCEINPQIDEKR